jgi:phage-related protein
MPQTSVRFYQESPGEVPVLDWMHELAHRDKRAINKCRAAIERLKELGYELRRPEADLLRDGIYELRVRLGRVNYRILYFFHGQGLVLLAHGLTKEREVPKTDIERAIARKLRFQANPNAHTYEEDDND